MKRLGITIGAVPLGAGSLAGGTAAEDAADSDIDVSVTELTGLQRDRLVWEATLSDGFAATMREFESVPDVKGAVEYEITGPDTNQSGYKVTFGDVETGDTVINYYRSTGTDFDVKAYGARATDEGVVSVDGSGKTTTNIGTRQARSVAKAVFDGRLSTLSLDASATVPQYDDAVVFTSQTSEKKVLNLPLEAEGEIVDVIEAEIPSGTAPSSVENLQLRSDRVSTMGHTVCGPWGGVCTDYCTILCSSLAGVSAAGCASACAGTIAGIPISPACGAICAGVVGGTCYATCTNQTGH